MNGAAGIVSFRDGEPCSLGATTIRDGRIASFEILAGAARLGDLDLPALGG